MLGCTPYARCMTVEVRHLRALVLLADSDSFTTAAAELGVTQPTFSRTISQLEEIVNEPLVERTTRSFTLTLAGTRLVTEARSVLTHYDHLLARFEIGDVRALRLGWAWAGLGQHTVTLLTEWEERSSVRIETIRRDDPVRALERGSIDAAIVRSVRGEARTPHALVSIPLFTETLVAAIPRSSSLAAQHDVTLTDLASHTVALCAVSPTVTLNLWLSRGVTPETVMAASTEEWLTHIAMGSTVGVTSAATSYGHGHPDVVYRRVSDSPEVEVSLLWHSLRPHPSVTAFADLAREYFRRFIGKVSPPRILTMDE